MIFNKHEECRGITLFKFKQFRAEIWYCPAGYNIVEHSHPQEDVELLYIFGSTIFSRRDLRFEDKRESAKPKFLRSFSVKHYHSHWFEVGKYPLVFINFQKFLKGNKPVSAATDFEVTKI